ncbi:hypothetical protein BHE74_00018762 [Ensete ventricosum]|nr:hypothetical protein BHE74_00018762 [Ensete ventricosum]
MYVHKPKDTDKLEHFIKHIVYILTVTAWGGVPSPRAEEKVPATRGRRQRVGTGDPRAATARRRGWRREIGTPLFFFFFFSTSSSLSPSIDRQRSISPSIDRRQPKSIADGRFLPQSTVDGRFLRNRPVASDPRNSNLMDRYVPLVPSGTGRNCKPWH